MSDGISVRMSLAISKVMCKLLREAAANSMIAISGESQTSCHWPPRLRWAFKVQPCHCSPRRHHSHLDPRWRLWILFMTSQACRSNLSSRKSPGSPLTSPTCLPLRIHAASASSKMSPLLHPALIPSARNGTGQKRSLLHSLAYVPVKAEMLPAEPGERTARRPWQIISHGMKWSLGS